MVSPKVHRSKRWAALDVDARLLGLYALTNEHQNSAGCYRLLPGYACADLGGWPLERFHAALEALEAAEIIAADSDTSEVMILRWFQHCPPTNSKHFQGTLRIANDIESERLRRATIDALTAAWDAVQAAKAARTAGEVVPISPALRRQMRPNS
jgi:hypothetical protein